MLPGPLFVVPSSCPSATVGLAGHDHVRQPGLPSLPTNLGFSTIAMINSGRNAPQDRCRSKRLGVSGSFVRASGQMLQEQADNFPCRKTDPCLGQLIPLKTVLQRSRFRNDLWKSAIDDERIWRELNSVEVDDFPVEDQFDIHSGAVVEAAEFPGNLFECLPSDLSAINRNGRHVFWQFAFGAAKFFGPGGSRKQHGSGVEFFQVDLLPDLRCSSGISTRRSFDSDARLRVLQKFAPAWVGFA